jgi:arylsulfatase A-like enzyme
VANVDLAPTFCQLAGCSIAGADGRSLVSLIKHQGRPRRAFIFTEMLHASRSYGSSPQDRPAWSGVVTTKRYDRHIWSYARYRTGEEELYDITADPYQLHNLARRPFHKGRLKDMRAFWRKVWNRDGVTWRFKLP